MIILREVLGSPSVDLGAGLSGVGAMEKASLSYKIARMQKGESAGNKCVGSPGHLSTLVTGRYPRSRITASYVGTN